MNTFGLKNEVISFITTTAHTLHLDAVVLFGSRARGDYFEKSDIDIAFLGGETHAFIEQMEENCPTLLKFDLVDLNSVVSPELKANILKNGVVLYGQI